MNSGPVAQLRPEVEEIEVLERGGQRLDRLAGEHGAHRLDGAGDGDRHRVARALEGPLKCRGWPP